MCELGSLREGRADWGRWVSRYWARRNKASNQWTCFDKLFERQLQCDLEVGHLCHPDFWDLTRSFFAF